MTGTEACSVGRSASGAGINGGSLSATGHAARLLYFSFCLLFQTELSYIYANLTFSERKLVTLHHIDDHNISGNDIPNCASVEPTSLTLTSAMGA